MRSVSRRVSSLVGLSALVLVLVTQPAFAARRDAPGDSPSRVILRSIIKHILDLTEIRFPPG